MAHTFRSTRAKWSSRRALIIALGAGFILATGCGDGGPEIIPVHGKVMFGGKSPPGPGTVYFAPLAAADGASMRPGSADFNLDGMFRARAFKVKEGLVPGTYRIQIYCWKRPPDFMSDIRAGNLVPNNFHPPDLTIEPGTKGPIAVEYDVLKSK